MAVACRDVEAAALAIDGSPPITRTTFPTCRAHYPGGSSGCACRLLPRSRGLPQMAGGSASALSLSRPAQASLTLRPVGLLSRLKRPLSRGSSPSGCPAEPLVSYQINRQLSGWNLPPLVIRAFGAHCQEQTLKAVSARVTPSRLSICPRRHSIRMLARLITSLHRFDSAATKAAVSSGVPTIVVRPCWAKRSRFSEVEKALFASA